MEKICFKCGELKPLTEFYKHSGMSDGRVNKCKECSKSSIRENYRKNLDYYKEYNRRRANLPHRVELRRVYQQTHPEVVKKARQRFIAKNPEKRQAHILVGNAVRDGRLTKQPCEICGESNVHGHHDDYSKPLDVRWFCPKHHSERHKNLGLPF